KDSDDNADRRYRNFNYRRQNHKFHPLIPVVRDNGIPLKRICKDNNHQFRRIAESFRSISILVALHSSGNSFPALNCNLNGF
ncbi:MAG: hypothetical protein J6X87_07260, partial [Clostridia bacterium]|nr:hypothetical protein [Clostridia bacterium]